MNHNYKIITMELAKIPTLAELVSETETSGAENALMIILNQPPPPQWCKPHPTAKTKDAAGNSVPALYLPIERVEYLLNRIFGKWWVEIRDSKVIANSVSVTVRLYVTNPITNTVEWQDGVGAKSIQTKAGASAMDWAQVNDAGVMMALPSAESYAIKDAAEKWGKIFGKDLNRRDNIDYNSLLKQPTDWDALNELYLIKQEAIHPNEQIHFERIIKEREIKSYKKVLTQLQKL